MIATADKWESSPESVASAWLLSTAVARGTGVSLMETRISENFHLPHFHWSQQPFLWKQSLRASGREVTAHLLTSGVATSLCASFRYHRTYRTRIHLSATPDSILTLQQESSALKSIYKCLTRFSIRKRKFSILPRKAEVGLNFLFYQNQTMWSY